MSDTPTPPDGWYPDPAGGGGLRRWDGASWTDEVRSPDGSPAGVDSPVEDTASDAHGSSSLANADEHPHAAQTAVHSDTAQDDAIVAPLAPAASDDASGALASKEPAAFTTPAVESDSGAEPERTATSEPAATDGDPENDEPHAPASPEPDASVPAPRPAAEDSADTGSWVAPAGGGGSVTTAASAPEPSSTGAAVPPAPDFSWAPEYPGASSRKPVSAEAATPVAYPGASAAYPGAAVREYDTAPRRDVPTNTVWIWVLVVLPLLGVLSLFAFDWGSFVRESVYEGLAAEPVAAPSTAGAVITAVSSVLSLLLTAATVLFAFLDWRQLRERGIERPFSWAWSFFVLVIGSGLVYIIGRCVIVRRQTGKGLAPLWAAIGVTVLTWIIASIWVVIILTQVFSLVQELQYTYGY